MTFTPPPRKEVLGAWNITVVLYCLHPIGGGFWYIVVTNLVKFEIARNDLAKAAALWGLYEFISKASRLITGSTIGAFSDRYGRKPVIAANFLAAIIVVNIMFFIPSTGTLFLGAVITGVFDVIDVSIMALVFVDSQIVETPTRKKEEQRRMSLGALTEDPSVNIEKLRTKMFGIVSASWVMCLGISIAIASVLTMQTEEDTLQSNSTAASNSNNATSCTSSNNATATSRGDTSYLNSSVYVAIFAYSAALVVTIVLLTETINWSQSAAKAKEEKISAMKSFKLLFGTPWLRLITACLMITDAVQFGYINALLWYTAYQFGWSISDYSMLLMWAMVCQCVATTVTLTYAVRYIGLFGTFYMSCCVGIFNLFATAISGKLGSWAIWLGMTGNMLTCHKPILRSKLCAEFSTGNQGKVQGGIMVANTLSQMAGTFLTTTSLSYAIRAEQGGGFERGGCNEPAHSLFAGLPYFILVLCTCATLVLVIWGRKFDPAGKGVGKDGSKVMPAGFATQASVKKITVHTKDGAIT